MDRRSKIISLSIGSVILIAVVLWFIIWPLLKPVLPQVKKAQPPEVAQPNVQNPQTPAQNTETPTTPTFTYNPSDHPDAEKIAELSRRAGIFSETYESGSSEKQFDNLLLAAQDASPKLSERIRADREAKMKSYPAQGELYLTIARRLVEIPENKDVISGDTFHVRVQMQIQIKKGTVQTREYKEADVTFTNVDGEWLLSGYDIKPYNP